MTSRKFMTLILLLLVSHHVQADIEFDDFEVNVLDDDLDVGDKLEIRLKFEEPDETDSVEAEIEVTLDDETIFLDEDYAISFVEDEDKTITIRSTDFPGPDLEHDVFNGNLLGYECGEYEITVMVSGRDIEDDLEDGESIIIGEDDDPLNFTISPEVPGMNEKITVRVLDDDGDEVDDALVKVTWIDDRVGDTDGVWDSEDDDWTDDTDRHGEVDFRIDDEFAKDAWGRFQVDVYGDGYCLTRGYFNISKQELYVTVPDAPVEPGTDFLICVTDENEENIYRAEVRVTGPGHSKTYDTHHDGCVGLNINTLGEYGFTVSKPGYEDAEGLAFSIGAPPTTTLAPTITSPPTTTVKPVDQVPQDMGKLIIVADKREYSTGDEIVITVLDGGGMHVPQVSIIVTPSDISGRTDSLGSLKFKLSDPGNYRVSAEKEGFNPAHESLTVLGSPVAIPGEDAGDTSASGAGSTYGLLDALGSGSIGWIVGLIIVVGILAVVLSKYF
ncbi:carboxypeptidase-like regulatory domain-containing protein [Candidatus Altiarchaeota archaeon]